MASLLDLDRARAAREKNLIDDRQFAAMGFPVEGPASIAPPAPAPDALGPEPMPENYFTEVDPLASQRDFWAQKKEKEAAAVAGAELRRLDAEAAELERKRQIAARMGVSQFEIDQKLPQTSFQAPVDAPPMKGHEDPYLASDADREREKAINELGMNYPGAGAYGQIGLGIRQQGDAMREHSREQAIAYQRAMDQIESYGKDSSIREIAQRAQSEKALADLEMMREDLASTKIDSKRLFANMGTGDKILASIGMILGGIGGATNGGQNRAVEVIERAIERDVNDQKAAYNIKKEGITQKDSLYGRMLEKFKNEGAAREATKLNMLKMTELQLATIGARYNDEATKGKVNEQLGKLQLLQDQAKAAFMNAMMGGDDPYRNMDEKQAARYVPGYGFTSDPKLRDKAVEATTIADGTIQDINTILSKSKESGTFDFGKNQELGVLVQLLRSANREAILGPGTVQEAERAMIEDLIKNPGAFFASKAKAERALEVIRDAAARTRNQKLKSFGVVTRSNQLKTLRYE